MPVKPRVTGLACALMLATASFAWSADTSPAKKQAKPAAKTTTKSAKVPTRKADVKASPKALTNTALKRTPTKGRATRALRGPTETLTCRNGTEDRHARIGVVLVGGKVDSFAYYSKWKPRTCSIYLQRNRDPYSHWTDKGNVTSVSLERGSFTIEQHKGEYRFVFRDIDRERYCGMDGRINGTLTIHKGSESCQIAGVMEEGVPLGKAYANVEQTDPAGASTYGAGPAALYNYGAGPETPPGRQIAQRPSRRNDSAFPVTSPGVSD